MENSATLSCWVAAVVVAALLSCGTAGAEGTQQPLGGGIAIPGILSANPAGMASEPKASAVAVIGTRTSTTDYLSGETTQSYSGAAALLWGGGSMGVGVTAAYRPPSAGITSVPLSASVATRMDRVSLGLTGSSTVRFGGDTSTYSNALYLDAGLMFAQSSSTSVGVVLRDFTGSAPRLSLGLGYGERKRYAIEGSLTSPPLRQEAGTASSTSSWGLGVLARVYAERFGFGFSFGTTVGGASGSTSTQGVVGSLRFGKGTYLVVSIPLSSTTSWVSGGLIFSW